jgi:hypothetical protein
VADAIVVILSFTLGIAIPAWIIRFDMRRLSGERLERAWPDVSLWASVVAFGPLCIPVHFWKTRRSALGLLLGCAWCIAAWVALAAVTSGAAWILE